MTDALPHPLPRLPRPRGPRVLVVDDEASVCRSMERILDRVGFDVTMASSGPEALAILGDRDFAAVVTDQNMPGMSGAELVDRILELAPHLREHIVVTSGNLDTPETRALLLRTGCLVLEKPFRLADLSGAVTRAAQGVRSPR